MKTMRAIVLLLLLLFIANGAMSQEMNDYTIITYERRTTPNQHGTQVYYRITKTDSLQNAEQDLPPLYFEGFTTQALKGCCSNSASEIFSFREDSKFDFSNEYNSMMSNLKSTVTKNRRKIQRVRKIYPDNSKEIMTVYATPITGRMCSCMMIGYDTLISKYEGIFYMPLSIISLDKKLWEDKKLFYKTVSRDYGRTQVSTGF